MTNPDLRGFRDDLAAARERAGHRVDAAVADLGVCRRALSQARARESGLESSLHAQALRSRPPPGARVQPPLAAVAASQLQSLQAQLAAAREDVGRHRQALDAAQHAVREAQTRREAFERQRADALADFQRDAARARQAALDDDWLARRRWLDTGRPAHDGENTR